MDPRRKKIRFLGTIGFMERRDGKTNHAMLMAAVQMAKQGKKGRGLASENGETT